MSQPSVLWYWTRCQAIRQLYNDELHLNHSNLPTCCLLCKKHTTTIYPCKNHLVLFGCSCTRNPISDSLSLSLVTQSGGAEGTSWARHISRTTHKQAAKALWILIVLQPSCFIDPTKTIYHWLGERCHLRARWRGTWLRTTTLSETWCGRKNFNSILV